MLTKLNSNSRMGVCGLSNLGNTCFMNSSLQVVLDIFVIIQGLSHAYELTEFLISNQFVDDLNEKNPLGSGGHLVAAYAELLKEMWAGSDSSVSPWNIKNVVGKFAQ